MEPSQYNINAIRYSANELVRIILHPDADWAGDCDCLWELEEFYPEDDEGIIQELEITEENLTNFLAFLKRFQIESGINNPHFDEHLSKVDLGLERLQRPPVDFKNLLIPNRSSRRK